jgi:pimeloyl-ACP methyl ester carboxylesterase
MVADADMKIEYLERTDGERVAYVKRSGASPGIVWLGGFRSEMNGNKARSLDAWAARKGHAVMRFDYFGHGQSSGDFRKGTITRWRDDALSIIDTCTEGPQILVGSSMGAWIALLCAFKRATRIKGLLLIAPATDFTDALLWQRLPDDVRQKIKAQGEWLAPSAYDTKPYPITRELIEDGRQHLLLGSTPIRLHVPVRVLQGMRDPDVPWQHALRLIESIEGDARITLTRDGDHRLSKPSDLKLIERELEALIADVS